MRGGVVDEVVLEKGKEACEDDWVGLRGLRWLVLLLLIGRHDPLDDRGGELLAIDDRVCLLALLPLALVHHAWVAFVGGFVGVLVGRLV